MQLHKADCGCIGIKQGDWLLVLKSCDSLDSYLAVIHPDEEMMHPMTPKEVENFLCEQRRFMARAEAITDAFKQFYSLMQTVKEG